jgi:RNA polymerase sigma-70 factor (ECF subfamily)
MPVLSEVVGVSTVDPATTVRDAQGGSVPAFERLYREHCGRIYALCLRLAADPVQAEELTQDVFIRAWEKLASFRGDSAFGTWLHRLAVNEVLGRRRADGRRGARVMLVEDLTVYEVPRASQEGIRLDLEAAMAKLPEATRTVFVMHDVEGFTHEEIARLTGRAEGTCKTLLHRARKMLRERLR